ncbi:MAG: HAD hydrolase-like protein [Proteobacteria bacterium]|jgi:phosphoglycolate phosphatase-like HAD superfamily hydrolase|nr:HAD hydrolase-like protein [Pseudomonadota bacterium]MDA0872775.1 HAD hydrolase-like protein [Pseudomonadota bacterium]MDA1133964.1 HAD hydrolase-like protein [Pseudomonadota bacterium]
MPELNQYRTIIFDCDGVVLNSNFQKIEAYRNTAIKFGASKEQAQALVDHHVALTGISRYVKFDFFLKNILKTSITENKKKFLVDTLNDEVIHLLKDCQIAEGLASLKQQTVNSRWMIASGGDQSELRYLFKEKKIEHYFESGIFGSPRSKHQIIQDELPDDTFFPAIFLGDSLYDIETAKKFNLDFIFLYGWTDLHDWQKICKEMKIRAVKSIKDLIH